MVIEGGEIKTITLLLLETKIIQNPLKYLSKYLFTLEDRVSIFGK